MDVLVQRPTGGTVYRATAGVLVGLGLSEFNELVRAHKAGQITLDNDGRIILTLLPTAYGTEGKDAVPPVPWTDEQVAGMAAAISAALVDSPTVPVDSTALAAIEATVKRAVKSISFTTQARVEPDPPA